MQSTSVFAAAFVDPEDMAAALRTASVEYFSTHHRTTASAYAASLAVVQCGTLTLQCAEDDAHIASGEVARDCALVLFPIGGVVEGLSVNAFQAGAADAVLYGPGTELRAVCPGRQAWAALSLSGVDRVSEWVELPRDGSFTTFRSFLAEAPSLARHASEIGHLARHDPGRLLTGTVPQALVEHLEAGLVQALRPAIGAPGRLLQRRVRLVAAADAWLSEAIGRAVYSQDLADALGVSVRTLHDAFHAVVGMSVQRYLRVRRLHLVRAALRCAEAEGNLVKEAALRYGFWHLGRFAQAYRATFGERPSDTLAASLARRANGAARPPVPG